jgi:Tol biopolymer transport system component
MSNQSTIALWSLVLSAAACASVGGAAPTGSKEKPTDNDAQLMEAIGAKVKGTIVWSSSRNGNHDLFVMATDGSGIKSITSGDAVDWFPRFSYDGSKILFTRSKKGWVSERDANDSEKWDLYTIKPDGTDVEKVVTSASWGSWIGPDEIIYVRGTKIFRSKVGSKEEVQLMDSAGVADLDGALLQQPEMSRDGKYIAITLRGSKRETGIWDIKKKTWTKTGLGCQINWNPDNSSIYWVNPTGNGGSEVRHMPIKNGKPPKDMSEDEQKLIDMPGRRSHEYFPQLSVDGKWMVWGITQRGHDHDIADYEIYEWEVGTPPETAARLTFHSGNDRWPDIFIPAAAAQAPSSAPPEGAAAEAAKEPVAADAGDSATKSQSASAKQRKKK